MHSFMDIYLLPLRTPGSGEPCDTKSIKMANIPAITRLGICPKEIIRGVHRDEWARMCIIVLFVIVRYWRLAKCPTRRGQ